MVPAAASPDPTSQASSAARTVIGPASAGVPPPPAAGGAGAVLVQPARAAAAAARTAVLMPARGLRDMVLLGLRDGGGGGGGLALRQQEEGEHDRDVGDPDDRRQHRGLRREVEDALEQGSVPGVRRDDRADVEA